MAMALIQYDAGWMDGWGWGHNRAKVVETEEGERASGGSVHNAITGAAVSGIEQRRTTELRGRTATTLSFFVRERKVKSCFLPS